MAGKPKTGNPVPVGDIVGGVIDPVLRRRAGISMGLVNSWEEIVGPRLAAHTRPEKIAWPRQRNEDDPFEPAVLHIACEGFAALALQHETGEVIARVNGFLGFAAIGRVRIVQKPVRTAERSRRPAPRPLSEAEVRRLAQTVSGIEDDGLRAALARLGATVTGTKR